MSYWITCAKHNKRYNYDYQTECPSCYAEKRDAQRSCRHVNTHTAPAAYGTGIRYHCNDCGMVAPTFGGLSA